MPLTAVAWLSAAVQSISVDIQGEGYVTKWPALYTGCGRINVDGTGKVYLWLNPTPEVTWYGWDGDRLTTTQTNHSRIKTIYTPGSFTPLVRIETDMEELAKAAHRTLAEKLQQDAGMTFVPELVAMLDGQLRRGEISAANQQWLTQCGLTPEQMKN